MADEVPGADAVGDDAGEAAIESLWDDEAEAFLEGRENEERSVAEGLGEIELADGAVESEGGCAGVGFEVLVGLRGGGAVEVRLPIWAVEFSEGLEECADTFAEAQLAGEQDAEGDGICRAVAGVEDGGVRAIGGEEDAVGGDGEI